MWPGTAPRWSGPTTYRGDPLSLSLSRLRVAMKDWLLFPSGTTPLAGRGLPRRYIEIAASHLDQTDTAGDSDG